MKLTVLVAFMMLTGISYSQEIIPIPRDTLYIIDGVPETSYGFQNIKSEDIISFKILKNTDDLAILNCRNPDRVIIVITTIKALTKRERRKYEKKKLQIP
ncbi:hypothetical protein [Flavobacterium sp.]|uniref:hypothetical protein n=1 Tax=Flavobacterium sp. TaxID=239 RepID=UPI0026382333|nr:hypothetical protein [Flavobacterium sp.]